jgi:hypothetical protein
MIIGWLVDKNNKKQGVTHANDVQSSPQQEDNRYMERLFVLDAAEHGFFVPGAESVFDDHNEEEDDGYYPDEQEDPDPNEGIY